MTTYERICPSRATRKFEEVEFPVESGGFAGKIELTGFQMGSDPFP